MTKKYDFWTLQPYLILHIKRFQEIEYKTLKIVTHIDFPIDELDLTPYCIGPNSNTAVYSTYAILVNFYKKFFFNITFLGS